MFLWLLSIMTQETRKYMDLHTHSIYSDGTLSPEDIVWNAKLNGLDAIALTDHDSIDGLERAKKAAEKFNIALVPGIEFTLDKYHLLAFNFCIYSESFKGVVAFSRKVQHMLTERRVEHLKNNGIPINMEKVLHYSPEARLGKFNIAMAMMQDPECSKYIQERHGNISGKNVLDLYLNRTAIVPYISSDSYGSPTLTTINRIHEAGGIAVLAHAANDIKNLEELDVLRRLGIDGLEIQMNGNRRKYDVIEEYAKEHDLLITYGSDYHGPCLSRNMLSREDEENFMSEELRRRLGIK